MALRAQLRVVAAARRERGAGRRGARERARRGAAPGARAARRRRPLRLRRGRAARARRQPRRRRASAKYEHAFYAIIYVMTLCDPSI